MMSRASGSRAKVAHMMHTAFGTVAKIIGSRRAFGASMLMAVVMFLWALLVALAEYIS
jgi:hypothetical protein